MTVSHKHLHLIVTHNTNYLQKSNNYRRLHKKYCFNHHNKNEYESREKSVLFYLILLFCSEMFCFARCKLYIILPRLQCFIVVGHLLKN
jgi:hypothetical protein